jgi:hypothetical protein
MSQPIEECLSLKRLEGLLQTHARPGVTVAVQLGAVARQGGDLGMFANALSERAYNAIYQFLFYSNDWAQRVLDVYHVIDCDHGSTVFRVDHDGSKHVDDRRTLATAVMLADGAPQALDYHIAVTQQEGDGMGRAASQGVLLKHHQSEKLFATPARRVYVEEIALIFSASFRVVLRQQTFLETFKTAHTAAVVVSMAPADGGATNDAYTLFSQPDAATVFRTLRAMELAAAAGEDGELNAAVMADIAAASATIDPAAGSMTVLDF